MTKEEAIEQLKSLRAHCASMEFEIFKKDTEAIDYILKYIEELQKGQNTLMSSRKKWKYRYYKMKKENKDLEKSVEQIYEDYQDIGKIAFDDGEKIEMLEKQIDLMAEFIEERLDTCPFEDYDYNLNCENECKDDYKKCWKQYFENEVRQESDKGATEK